jgi:hypothetical protein
VKSTRIITIRKSLLDPAVRTALDRSDAHTVRADMPQTKEEILRHLQASQAARRRLPRTAATLGRVLVHVVREHRGLIGSGAAGAVLALAGLLLPWNVLAETAATVGVVLAVMAAIWFSVGLVALLKLSWDMLRSRDLAAVLDLLVRSCMSILSDRDTRQK